MARHLIIVAVLGLALTGCVPQEKYNALKIEAAQLAERASISDAEALAARTAADNWKTQLDQVIANSGDHEGMVRKYLEENGLLQGRIGVLQEQLRDALSTRVAVTGPVNPQLSNALTALAAKYPEMMEFDSARGTVKFKDVTFPTGSDQLTPAARQVVQKFAEVLNTPAAREYEFLIGGHTDAIKVSNPETIRQGHKDNWYLSSHRAISVKAVLAGNGVSEKRIGVVGYADQRPIATNATAAGRERNRRVEVMILPSTAQGAVAASADATAAPITPRRAAPVAPAKAPALNKDTITVDPRPVYNK